MTDLCQRIGDWAAAFRVDALRASRVRVLVRDFAACVAAGSTRAELAPALLLTRPGIVSVWGRPERFDMPSAALVCGTAGSLLQLHDIYVPAMLHPSCAVVAAAWAARGGRSMPGSQFVNAVAAGYEVCNRLADAMRSGKGRSSSVATATAGALGAAVASALVRDGSAMQVARALSLVPLLMPVTPVAAVRVHADAVALHGGLAARAAVEAALLAAELQNVSRVLEGDDTVAGYWQVLCGGQVAVAPDQWDGSTLDAVIGKRWPGCFGAYAALEAVLNGDAPQADEITAVRIGLPGRLLPMVELGPTTGLLYDRLMSVRWLVARALERRRLAWDDLDGAARTDRLAARIELHHAALLDGLDPSLLAANVEIETGSSLRFSRQWQRALTDLQPRERSTLMQDEAQAWRQKYQALTAAFPDLNATLAGLLDEE